VLAATLAARRQLGEAWFFDLSGHGTPPGCRALRWSPVQHASDWQRAQLIAEAMTGAAELESDAAHWRERASALIACALHAAARSGRGMRELSGWILRHDSDAPLAALDPGSIAADVLQGIRHTAERERSGIFSTAARVLRAYRSEVALNASQQPSFDADAFARVERHGVHRRARARAAAPRPAGRRPAGRCAPGDLPPRVAARPGASAGAVDARRVRERRPDPRPLHDLPAMLSEAGGQGLQVVVVLQDFSQARRRWPREADGMLSLFGARMILSGIADVPTLNQLSLIAGDWDRPVQTITEQRPAGLFGPASQRGKSEAWSTRRERVLPPDSRLSPVFRTNSP